MAENQKRFTHRPVIFIRPEIMVGKALPASSDFPNTRMQNIYSISIGKQVKRTDLSWPAFFNFPEIGITASKTTFGNADIIGNAFTLMPFIAIRTSGQDKRSFHFRLGLGTSYFTAFYDKYSNPTNKAIGSRFTWSFLSSAEYTLVQTSSFNLRLGLTYFHHSNGHTQLPNLGLNSFLVGLSSSFYLSPVKTGLDPELSRPRLTHPKRYFIAFSSSIGMHEFGNPGTNLERIKKAVYGFSFSGGVVIHKVIRVSGGFAYRFYEHYYSYIMEGESPGYRDYPVLNASNLYLFAGCEFLLGHVGIDTELGINLFKPFYSEHHRLWETDNGMSYWLKRTIVSRLGLKLYMFNEEKNPARNVFVGCHINANMGQADFSGLSIGYIQVIGKKGKETKYRIP